MKANAPEKIYLQQYDENTLIFLNKWNISEEWSNKPCNEKVATNIEYVRKDAFIEKVIKFFTPHIQDNSGGYDRANVIENFRNYMKGE